MSVWLSVIMPVHNGGHYLRATLDAAAAEQPDGVEFLIYDSSDDGGACAAIVQGFAQVLNLSYHVAAAPRAWTAKTNRGATEAQAAHLAMLHQDDLWLPGHLRSVRKAIAGCPEAALHVGPSRFISATGRDVGLWRLPFAVGRHNGDEAATTLIVQNTIAIPSPVIRRDAWLSVGGMDETLWYTADWDLYLKLSREGPLNVRPEATTAFRLHGGSLTMTGSRDLTDFQAQQDIVVTRHAGLVPAGCRARQLHLARAAIAANVALSGATQRNWRAVLRGAGTVLSLGPVGWFQLLSQTRLLDRVLPRLRLSLAGAL